MRSKECPLSAVEEAQIREWGIPNWREHTEYQRADSDLSLDQWRWEFVRRDKAYRDAWTAREGLRYADYGLVDWADPRETATPEFRRACHLVKFNETDDWGQRLHYMALADVQGRYGLIFSVDITEPIGPQLELISEAHSELAKRLLAPQDRPQKAPRKNNSTAKSRSRSYLLRILDASNAGITAPQTLSLLAEEGSEKEITEAAMRKTIQFAKGFWKRL